ncbi:MAG: MarR family transcriptional regulator [Candidatus Peregrinibacteria bacterium]|nr:MarR family transcriptional regulator [Candidatus Peregrinibacteria bacterium]
MTDIDYNNMNSSNSTGDKVLIVLRSNPDGLTITEIVSRSRLSRSTVRVVLAKLEGKGDVSYRSIGMAKMYILEESNG